MKDLRSYCRREKASNKNTAAADNNKKILIMEAKKLMRMILALKAFVQEKSQGIKQNCRK
ncbi:MAG: hypothetical protein ACR5KW_02570 [Wolbachia sp.]